MKLIKDLGTRPIGIKGAKVRYGLFECPNCLKHFEVQTGSVRCGHTSKCRSCSSKIIGKTSALKHGKTNTRLYKIWADMIKRVTNKNRRDYKYYGDKGITVCKEWQEYFISFYNWAMANGYQDGLTIDRENNDGNYEPSNCRWTTKNVQARNTRKIMETNKTGYRGVVEKKSKNFIKYQATIGLFSKSIYIGTFETKEEAAYAYDEYVTRNNLEHTKNFN